MVCTANVEVAEGSIVVVKTGSGPAAADLRREGERLRSAEHPGVVAVLESRGDDDRWELRLAHGGRPANLLHPASADQVATIASSVASTLADLHDRGIVHGHLATRHVLVGPSGAVRICGFGATDGAATSADDVAAVGSVITELLGDREELEPLPEVRWRRRPAWSGVARRSLLAIADGACAEPPGRRPSARRLAAAIVDAVPTSTGRRGGRAPHARAPRLRRTDGDRRSTGRWRPIVAAVAGAALLAVGAWRGVDDRGGAVLTPQPARSAAPCALVEGPAGPCLPARVDGTTVVVGATAFEVGQPGDQVVLGDWDCDGAVTAAVRRPRTGELFVFPGWASDRPLEVQAVGAISDAVDLLAPDGPCGPPRALRRDGAIEPIPVEGAR